MNQPVPMTTVQTRPFPLRWPLALAGGALFVALAARVSIPLPFTVVPMTLQGPAVLLVGGLLGSAAGTGALVLYLVLGLFGAPVFAGGAAGPAHLVGPTAGYLLAFPVAALAVGRVAERGRLGRSLAGALFGMAIIHIGGWSWLAIVTGDPARAFAAGTAPFVLQDLLKSILAGLVLWRAHHALRLRA